MPRYIDTEDFKHLVNASSLYDTEEWVKVMNLLADTPTADVVEVVRCKDCKYASPNGEYGCKAYHFKLYETHEMKADDFCSRAERRE